MSRWLRPAHPYFSSGVSLSSALEFEVHSRFQFLKYLFFFFNLKKAPTVKNNVERVPFESNLLT